MSELLPLLISNVLVASALALVATFVGWSGKQARLSRWIWIAVFIKLVTPPLITVPIKFSETWSQRLTTVSNFLNEPRRSAHLSTSSAPDHSDVIAAGASTDVSVSKTEVKRGSIELARPSYGSMLTAIWLAGSAWLLIRGLQRYRRMVKLVRLAGEQEKNGTEIVRKLLNVPGDQFVPQVWLIQARISPMLFGIGRNLAIVCPRELWLSLDWQERTAFLAHEAAHYRRRDHWVRWLEWVVASIYWWLPLVVWARWQLERHEEVECDRAALNLLEQQSSQPVRRAYAEALLNVVDFLSEARTPVPRLASRMQPTSALEERLRWIMADPMRPVSNWLVCSGLVIGLLSLLIHPRASAYSMNATLNEVRSVSAMAASTSFPPPIPTNVPLLSESVPTATADLPQVPVGWWNQGPEGRWANGHVGSDRLHVQAAVGAGLQVGRSGEIGFTFDTRDVRGLAYIGGTERLVVGRNNGELHVWDAAAARSVSLIGKQASAITSLTWSAENGLVSSDRSGNVVRWDIQSGEIRASTNFHQAVSMVRWSSDGTELAVLVGDWSDGLNPRSVHWLDRSLNPIRSQRVTHALAALHHDTDWGWLCIDWDGRISQCITGQIIGVVPKHEVSGLVLCGDLFKATFTGVEQPQ